MIRSSSVLCACSVVLTCVGVFGTSGCGDESLGSLPATTSSASGGSGGGATTGGEGGADAGGGGAAPCGDLTTAPEMPCLAASAFADVAAIDAPELCVVARYEAPVGVGFDAQTLFTTQPIWGRHGGPVVVRPAQSGAASVIRLSAPDGASGVMTSTATTVGVAVPDGSYLGSLAVDAPFFDWTALAWSAPFGEPGGELVLARGSAVERRYTTAGMYGMAALGTCDAGRVLYTGLSRLGDEAPGAPALHAADSCGAADDDARLEPEGDAACGEPQTVATWGDATGPVAADAAGNVAVVMTTFDASFVSTNHARVFAAAAIARGAAPTEGVELFTLDGFGSNLAVIAPRDADAGMVLFQPSDSATAAPLDVVAQRFSVSGVDATVVGAPAKAIETQGREAVMFRDGSGRIWLAVTTSADSSTMLVLDRAH